MYTCSDTRSRDPASNERKGECVYVCACVRACARCDQEMPWGSEKKQARPAPAREASRLSAYY